MANINLGFIGYHGHASRLINAFTRDERCQITHFYHPVKLLRLSEITANKNCDVITTKNLDDLFQCDAIIIASPNHTHFQYLEILMQNYHGYIFCEKPPVNQKIQLEKLIDISHNIKQRIYFNFNMRYSLHKEVMTTYINNYELGDIVKINISVGHGLGFKESYKNSWRADAGKHQTGVLETLGIHFIDLMCYIYGEPESMHKHNHQYSPFGNAKDTSHILLSFKNGCTLNMTCSYCTPFLYDINVICTNGLLHLTDSIIKICSPRDIFDRAGRFTSPPCILEERYTLNEIYENSIVNSCYFFISEIVSNNGFKQHLFDTSILSNRLIFN